MSIILAGCSLTENVTPAPLELESFAQCVTDTGATMYGTEWCSHCRAQKATFQSAFELINFVDCDVNSARCQEAGITGYPSWIINGEKYEGSQTITKLATITGCSLITEKET